MQCPPEDLLQVAHRDLAACNARDIEKQLSIFHPDAEFTALGVRGRGRQQVADFSHAWWEAFPDARVSCERTVVSGSLAVAEGTFTGTHVATLRLPVGDFPATGNRVVNRFVAVYEVRDGLIAAKHLYFDHLPLLGHPA